VQPASRLLRLCAQRHPGRAGDGYSLKGLGEFLNRQDSHALARSGPRPLGSADRVHPDHPRTSPFHCSEGSKVNRTRTALTSLEIMSHQRASVFSVENPWSFLKIEACPQDLLASLVAVRRSNGLNPLEDVDQSMTAEVGQRLASMAMEPRSFGSALPLLERASMAASFRMARSAVGKGGVAHHFPFHKPLRPVSILS